MGAFDDLIPTKGAAAAKKPGAFDDLIPKAKPKRTALQEVGGFMSTVNRGLILGDELAAVGNTVADVATGKVRGRNPAEFGGELVGRFKGRLADQRAIEDDFTARRPMTAAAGRGSGMALTAAIPTSAAVSSGNAVMAGVRGATTAAMTGYAAGLGDRGNLDERVRAANTGAVIAAPLGFVLGAGAHMMTNRPTVEERAVRDLAKRAGLGPEDLRAEAANIRENAADPALVDVVDESGRGVLRAAASRQTPARTAARDFADQRAMSLPDRMSQQARRTISPDPRTPDQIATELGAGRRVAADAQFGAVRNERLPLSEDAVMALRTPDGRGAIRQAAAASARSLRPEDRAIAAELNRLADDVLDKPGQVEVTVGMSQSISEALLDAADAAARAGRNREASSLGDLGRAIRENARTAVPGYDEALTNYATQSRIMDAAGQGEDFLKRNTDEFVAAAAAMSPEERAVAQATARRAVERASGESTAAAPGVARRLAMTPEQGQRNVALLGPERADTMQRGMMTEARMVQNARDISPTTGSQTQIRSQDAEAIAKVAEGARDVAATFTGNPGAILGVVINRLKTIGMSDREAQALVEIAINPSRLQEAIGYLEPRVGRAEALNIVRELRAVGVGSAPPRGQPVDQSTQGPSDRRASMTGASR